MEYTYQNWLKGKFDYNHIFDENNLCLVSKEDLKKINKKQEELFNKNIELKTKQHKSIVNELLANSPKQVSFIENACINLETLFQRPLSDQTVSEEYSEFKINGKVEMVEVEYIDYGVLVKIPKNWLDFFQQIYRKYINLGLYYYECISNPLQIENNVEAQIHIKAHVTHNIYEYLKGLKAGLKSNFKPKKIFKGYQSYKFYLTKSKIKKLKTLFDFLVIEKYIHPDTDFQKFEKAFSGDLVHDKLNILWEKANVDFGVFIGLLIHYNLIDEINYNSIAINSYIFCKKEGDHVRPLSKIKAGKNSVKLNDQDLNPKYKKLHDLISSLS